MKRLLILLLTCCVFVLSGCGGDDGYTVIEIDQEEMLREFLEEKGITWEEYQQQLKEQEEAAQRPPEEVEDPPAIEESVIHPGIQIENDNLKKNFELVCDQVGIDTDKITEMQPAGEWNGGPAYSFMYEDLLLVMMCNTDNTVARIAVNGNIQVFLQNDSAYNISEFIVDQDVMVQVESIAEKLLRDELKLKDTEELPLTDWQPTRNSNVYSVIGSIVLQDDDQGTYFAVGVEVSKDVKKPTLRYFSIGDKVYKDEFAQMKNPEAMVSIEQTADVLFNGDIIPARTVITAGRCNSAGFTIISISKCERATLLCKIGC